MPFYKIKVRSDMEYGGVFEAPNSDVAVDIAKLEARAHSEILDQFTSIEEVPDPAYMDEDHREDYPLGCAV